jgi:hypothetical protein
MSSEQPAQRIVVFQQRGSGDVKIAGVREHGRGLSIAAVVDIDDELPLVLDDPGPLLPDQLAADLVLDFLRHPDLRHELALRCRDWGIPVVSSGTSMPVDGLVSPPTWCGLSRQVCLGPYGEQFGAPIYRAEQAEGKVTRIEVLRGAPCAATWDAAVKVVGLPVDQAIPRIGLEVQMLCKADPSNWDPLHGNSPIHFAGKVHSLALKKGLE